LAGFYWPTRKPTYKAVPYLLEVPGGDKIALHDDCPPNWQPTDRVALLLHGLAGCHESGYMWRLSERLNARGIRCFRMDMRGTGASTGKAKLPGHAGRTEDAAIAINWIAEQAPNAPLTMAGFSMGGNITLSTAANAATESIGNLERCIAVCPPADLSRCCRELQKGTSNFYDQYLIRFLIKKWQQTGGQITGAAPRSIYEFDNQITAPLSGFRDAEDYYSNCSSGPRLTEIKLPTKLLAAQDDPVVAYSAIAAYQRSPSVELITTASGGHLGYFSSSGLVDDGRWMDWQMCEWIDSDW